MLALDSATAKWIVILHNDAPEVCIFNRFMTALRWRFKDPLDNRKAETQIKAINQRR